MRKHIYHYECRILAVRVCVCVLAQCVSTWKPECEKGFNKARRCVAATRGGAASFITVITVDQDFVCRINALQVCEESGHNQCE